MARTLWQLDMLDDVKVAGRRQLEPFYFTVINFILDRRSLREKKRLYRL